MTRLLLVGQDHATAQGLGLQCLERGVGIVIAENVCEGVRVLASTPVTLIVVEVGRLRLGVHDQARLFDRVAPGVPVVVTVPPETPLETRVTLELVGFRVLPFPPALDDLLKDLD